MGDGGRCFGRKINGRVGVGETLREVRKNKARREGVRKYKGNKKAGGNLQEQVVGEEAGSSDESHANKAQDTIPPPEP